MNNIEVKDLNLLVEQCESVSQTLQNVLHNVEQLYGISSKISSYWQSDTVDKDTYLQSLRLSLEKAYKLIEATKILKNQLLNYAQTQIANTQNGILSK